MGNNPSHFKRQEDCFNHAVLDGIPLCPDNPVEMVSWHDAQKFIEKLNNLFGGYRLPTEAEWEYAARAGTETAYFFGDSRASLSDYGVYSKNSEGRTHPVGTKPANQWGLHDTSGNVWEWTGDTYTKNLGPGETDPLVHKNYGTHKVVRGGSWFNSAGKSRAAYRGLYSPYFKGMIYGLRLARRLVGLDVLIS